MASPVVVNGLFFMATGGGQMVCVDATTGKEVWTHKSPRCYASLVASGDRVYALGRDGTMHIVAAERSLSRRRHLSVGRGFRCHARPGRRSDLYSRPQQSLVPRRPSRR